MKIGLIVNPIAGVGAALAWKGSDNVEKAWKAVIKGAEQPVWKVIQRAILSIPKEIEIKWVLSCKIIHIPKGNLVYEIPNFSSPQNTIEATKELMYHNLDLLLFVGGDGTAAIIAEIIKNVPVLGLPAGVKIFSPCFLHRPEDLGDFLKHWNGETQKVDLLDLDEQAYQNGRAVTKLINEIEIPVSSIIQSEKVSWSISDSETPRLIAERIKDENMLDKTILIGPGSTMKAIFEELGFHISLLGVDLISHSKLIGVDLTKNEILNHKGSIQEIWLTPIGNQGHILGRGNRQISASLIKSLGKDKFKIFSSAEKIRNTPQLFVDSGDLELDILLQGYISIIVGYHEEILRKIV